MVECVERLAELAGCSWMKEKALVHAKALSSKVTAIRTHKEAVEKARERAEELQLEKALWDEMEKDDE